MNSYTIYPEVTGLSPDTLQWPDATSEQLDFMKRVYAINEDWSSKRGTFVNDLPDGDLDTIEGGYKARKDAAIACRNLLQAARSDIQQQGVNVKLGLTSAYRSASRQFGLWQSYFPQYYVRTEKQRAELPAGPHSEEAAALCAREVRRWISIPGYGLHVRGIAVDFKNTQDDVLIKNSSNARDLAEWRQSWFWNWLQANAGRYGFLPYTQEPWHWELKGVVAPLVAAPSEQYGQSIECGCVHERPEYFTGSSNRFVGVQESGGGSFQKLGIKDVHYLAMEGGGGKGFAYPGALSALQGVGILKYKNGKLDPDGPIKGIAGSSAGAITALFLAMGYEPEQIKRNMLNTSFNNFYDFPVLPREIPSIYDCKRATDDDILIIDGIVKKIMGSLLVDVSLPLVGNLYEKLTDLYKAEYRDKKLEVGDAIKKLKAHPLLYCDSLYKDYGFFSGGRAHGYFGMFLQAKLNNRNMTFEDLYKYNDNKIKLVITGTNIELQKLAYFSVDTTPKMPLALAVRISMGLPFIFKPVVISATVAKALGAPQLQGTWIDGGVKENLPLRVFDDHDATPHTLGLRLGKERRLPVDSFAEYLLALCSTLVESESMISGTSGFAEQTILLEADGLSTTNFNPRREIVETACKAAGAEVLKYFTLK